MDVLLQLGAHRTATTSFQTYLRQSSIELGEMGIGFWGPLRVRKGLFHGVIPDPKLGQGKFAFARAQGRIALQLERSQRLGVGQVIVSDENMLGIMRENLAKHSLYPAAGERTARYVAAFQGAIKTIHISIRCPSSYWPSAFSFCLPRGVKVPEQRKIDALAAQTRTWREVITDVAAAAPDIPIYVSTYEQHGARPQTMLGYLLGHQAPKMKEQIWRNRRPAARDLLNLPLRTDERERLCSQVHAGTWEPFTEAQLARLQESYADDLFWLRAGADSLAYFLEEPRSEKTEYPAQSGLGSKGQNDDTRQRLARPG